MTFESNPRFRDYSKARSLFNRRTTIVEADSRKFLRNFFVAEHAAAPNVLVYLDAHWGKNLPLRGELDTQFGTTPACAVMIDVFQVFDDSEYVYDEYGDGMALDVNYILPAVNRLGLVGFYPPSRPRVKSGQSAD